MKLAKKIDWLTATQTHETMELGKPFLPEWLDLGESTAPLPRFDKAWELKPDGMLALSATGTMCQLVQMTGKQLDKVRDDTGVSDDEIIQHFASHSDNITRVDYAIDVLETDWRPLDWLLLWQAGGIKSRFRTVMDFRTIQGSGGQTIYYGSKSSPQRVRIYDKAKEMKLLNEAWVRAELQARKQVATPLAADMARHGVIAAGDTRLRELFTFDSECNMSEIMQGQDVDLTKAPRNTPAWERWMNGQVKQSIENHAKTKKGSEFLVSEIDENQTTIITWFIAESSTLID